MFSYIRGFIHSVSAFCLFQAVYFNAFGFRSREAVGFSVSPPTSSICVDEQQPSRVAIPEAPLYHELRFSARPSPLSSLPEKIRRLMDADWGDITEDDYSALRSVIPVPNNILKRVLSWMRSNIFSIQNFMSLSSLATWTPWSVALMV